MMKKCLLAVLCLALMAVGCCALGGCKDTDKNGNKSDQSMQSELSTDSQDSASMEEHVHTFELVQVVVDTCMEYKELHACTSCSTTKYVETDPTAGHSYRNDVCTLCGKDKPVSKGLEYTLNEDGESYSVMGLGECTDAELFIPAIHEGLPVIAIEDGAFLNCDGLTKVEIPDSVIIIGDFAFYACSSLMNVLISDSVITIADDAFDACANLNSITVSDNNTAYQSIDGNLYNKEVSTLIKYAIGKIASEFVIPDSVMTIGSSAFGGCESLTSVVIPDSVTTIGSLAFHECYNLTSVVIGESVTTIEWGAFISCHKLVEVVNKSSFITVTKGDSANGGVGSTALAVYNRGDTFESKLSNDGGYIIYTDGAEKILVGYAGTETDLVLPSYITQIYQYAFDHCDDLTSVVIPDSVTQIGSSAFFCCYNLISVVIGDGVTTIGDGAFWFCYKLVEVVNNSTFITVTQGDEYESNGGVGSTALAVYNRGDTFESKLSNDGGYIIYTDGAEKILVGYAGTETDLVLPSYITQIYQYAFDHCDDLTSVVIPDSVTQIGSSAFSYCYNLISVIIPDSVTTIGDDVFAGYNNLIYNIKEGLKYLGNSNNPYLYLADMENKDFVTVTIDNNCKFIGSSAFYNCSDLTSVIIPDSVTTIGSSAFSYCGSLTSVVIPNSVTTIGSSAFYNCSGLTSVVIPDSVTTIDVSAFSDCSSLTSITIPDGVTAIGNSAFSYCYNLISVIIPDSVTTIGSSAFVNCESLTTVYYKGTESEWNNISIGSNSLCLRVAMKYYYSEEETSGCWHYDENGQVVLW